jgi:hypothetical protein
MFLHYPKIHKQSCHSSRAGFIRLKEITPKLVPNSVSEQVYNMATFIVSTGSIHLSSVRESFKKFVFCLW